MSELNSNFNLGSYGSALVLESTSELSVDFANPAAVRDQSSEYNSESK